MSELNYKELQEQGVFDIPYKAFEYMDNQHKRIKELELINFDSELHFDAAKEEVVRLKNGLETLLKSYKAQSGLPMQDEFNRGWVSAFACVHDDLRNLIK